MTPWQHLTAQVGGDRVVSSQDGRAMHALLFGETPPAERHRRAIRNAWKLRRGWQADLAVSPPSHRPHVERCIRSCEATVRRNIEAIRGMGR